MKTVDTSTREYQSSAGPICTFDTEPGWFPANILYRFCRLPVSNLYPSSIGVLSGVVVLAMAGVVVLGTGLFLYFCIQWAVGSPPCMVGCTGR